MMMMARAEGWEKANNPASYNDSSNVAMPIVRLSLARSSLVFLLLIAFRTKTKGQKNRKQHGRASGCEAAASTASGILKPFELLSACE
jgi:hypothetical protein